MVTAAIIGPKVMNGTTSAVGACRNAYSTSSTSQLKP